MQEQTNVAINFPNFFRDNYESFFNERFSRFLFTLCCINNKIFSQNFIIQIKIVYETDYVTNQIKETNLEMNNYELLNGTR